MSRGRERVQVPDQRALRQVRQNAGSANLGENGSKSLNVEDAYRLHRIDIYRYAYKLTGDSGIAEDLMQETFIRAHKFLNLIEDRKVKSWLFAVTRNIFIDWYRKRKREPGIPLTEAEPASDPCLANNPEIQILTKEIWERFEREIASYPLKQKLALRLFYVNQFTYEEIAGKLGISIINVKVAIHRGKKRLRKKWRSEEQPIPPMKRAYEEPDH